MEIEVDQEIHSQDADRETSDNQLLCAESSQEYGSLGDPEVLPRVGDEYQVELPPLVTASGEVSPENSKTYVNSIDAATHKFLVGLPLSIMWVPREVTNIKQESTEPSYNSIGVVNKSCEPEDVTTVLGKSDKSALQHERSNYREQRYCPLPCSSGDSWDDTEEAAFLLGLYIFGKNLVSVQKFVESKKRGDMLSFYYGKFYRSERYRRWSECRKMRSRKCIYGQKIFRGSRQQELLSRLLHHLSEERHNALLEASKSFGEGKILLEEYVLRLKATVGLHSLIKAVGIGKGKEDLTGIALEPLKANHVASGHPEIPVGKAWSTLALPEIINFLTGNYRLSKARSNDLFWEAVWPRLLARGWHSEQPKDHVYAVGPKHSLVFLIPGVKKFSRRKLVKGNHYFDSVSDVLNRVASEPGLLELENAGEQGGNFKEESGFANGSRLEKNDSGNQQRHCYLKPRTPNRHADFMKFTIVDTSLANGGTCKFRELRTLPVDMNSARSQDHSDDSEQESLEASTEKSNSDSSPPADKCGRNCCKATDISFNSGFPSSSLPADECGRNCCNGANISFDSGFPSNSLPDDKCGRNCCRATGISFDSGFPSSFLPADKCGRNCCKPTDIRFYPGLVSRSDISNKIFQVHASGSIEVTARSENGKTKMKRRMPPEKTMNDQPSNRRKAGDKGDVVPAVKRRRQITACSRSKATRASISSVKPGSEIKQMNASSCRDRLLASASTSSKGVPLEQKLSSPSPSCSSCPTSEATLSSTARAVTENANDEVQPRVLIDLNLPVHPEIENDEHLKTDVVRSLHEMSIGPANASEGDASGFMCGREPQPDDAISMKPSVSMPQTEAMPVMNSRRQSTRNRPLTTKALEALACVFLSTTQRRKRMDRTPPRRSSKASRRARGEMGQTDAPVGSIVNIKAEERGHDVSNCNGVIEQASNVMQTELSSNLGVSKLVNK